MLIPQICFEEEKEKQTPVAGSSRDLGLEDSIVIESQAEAYPLDETLAASTDR